MTATCRPLRKATREALAACEAVGLMFWSDHPRPRHVWAVDDHQRAHVVRIDRDRGTAQHVCCVERCTGDDETVPFIVRDDRKQAAS